MKCLTASTISPFNDFSFKTNGLAHNSLLQSLLGQEKTLPNQLLSNNRLLRQAGQMIEVILARLTGVTIRGS